MPGVYALQSPVDTGDTSLPIAVRDPLLTGANGGVKWAFDLAFPWSYPGGLLAGRPAAGAPANLAPVYDISETGNGSFVGQAGDVTSYAGGGFDFTACTKVGNYVQGAANAAASIWASPNQYFLMCCYLKLPLLADWNSSATLQEVFKFATGTYTTGAEVALIGMQNTPAFTVRRQTGAAAADIQVLAPNAADYGGFAQVAFWRDATGQYGRLKTANGVVQVSTTPNANNTQDFSALTPKLGMPPGFNGAAGAAYLAGQKSKFRIYRAFVENLVTSGRTASVVLDADYARTVARAVFS